VASHDDKTKAQAIAALLGGASLGAVEKATGIPRPTLQRWRKSAEEGKPDKKRSKKGASAPGHIDTSNMSRAELLETLIDTNIRALIVINEVLADPDYIRSQDIDKVGLTMGITHDKLGRTLESRERAANAARARQQQQALPQDGVDVSEVQQ
jgi:transposase-like protein